MALIKIVDKPCGYGKSTEILNSLNKGEKYIVVVPFLSEVERFIEGARKQSGFFLTQPSNRDGRKSDHSEKLISEGKSLVCTHQLFYKLGTLATRKHADKVTLDFDGMTVTNVKAQHLLDDYNVIIDEAITPFEHVQTIKAVEFSEVYLGMGLVKVHEDGRVEPTEKWDKQVDQGIQTFDTTMYSKAKSGSLYKLSDGLFILTVPTELLLKPKSVIIYTYMSEGSVLLHFLRKLQKDNPDKFKLEVERLDPNGEAEWRKDVASALTVESIAGLEGQAWNHTAQLNKIKTHKECSRVGYQLRKFNDNTLREVNLNSVMLTSARSIWCKHNSGGTPKAGRLAKHSRMFGHPKAKSKYSDMTEGYEAEWSTTGVQFVPNMTRGTNKHVECTTAIYLYDQHPNPQLLTFLGLERSSREAKEFANAYALTELVQWLFRSAIRRGGINGTGIHQKPRERVTIYIPSERMRNLLTNWLETGKVSSASKDGKKPKLKPLRHKRVMREKVAA